jgi:hypothetical protein
MKGAAILVFCASAVAAASLTFAVIGLVAERQAGRDRDVARRKRDALHAEAAHWQQKADEAERSAEAAERDTMQLLSAVKSLRAQPLPLLPVANARAGSVPASARARPETIDEHAVRVQRGDAARSDETTAAAQARAARGAMLDDAEQARLAEERAYQQQLAKKRAAEAMERAKFDEATRDADPIGKFNALIQRARDQAARAEFSAAIRTFNEAMAGKPTEVPVPPDVRELQAILQAQNMPIEVALVSDGETYVSIANTRAPSRFTQSVMKLLPGDYEIVGRRRGYLDVAMLVRVRADTPAPVVTVMCTRPLGP